METGISHVYELDASRGGITVKVTLTEEYDLLGNFSDLSVAVSVKSSDYKYTYYLDGSLRVNGTRLARFNSATPTHYVTTRSLNSYYRIRGQNDSYTGSPWALEGVAHETDGSKVVTVELDLTGYTSGGGGSGWNVTDSREIALTHIPRASTVGASDAYIGAVATVSVVRRSTDYTHSVAYNFGDLTGFLDADGSLREEEVLLTQSSIPFAIPDAFYYEIPDDSSGICTLTCRTYREGVQIGEEQSSTFAVTAKRELCTPVVSGTVEDTNQKTVALTGDPSKLVRFGSVAVCTITAEAKNGASIQGKTIAGVEVEGDSLAMEAVETGSISFTATDSRGYSDTFPVEADLIPYIHLTAVVSTKRKDPTSGRVSLEVAGNCFTGSFGAADNLLLIRCRVDGGDYMALEPVMGENTYTLTAELTGLDYLKKHTVEVEVSDCVETVTKSANVGKGIPVFDWGENDFVFHVPVSISGYRLQNIAVPEEDTDGVNKGYTDALAGQTLTAAAQAGKTTIQENLAIVKIAQGDLSKDDESVKTLTATGGWSAGYRLYVILMTMGDDKEPIAQILVPREQVADNDSGQLWNISTAISSKKIYVYQNRTDLIVKTYGHTGSGGGNPTYIYGLFPGQTQEEEV